MKGNFETLTALAERIEAIEKAKEDYIVSTGKLQLTDPDHVSVGNGESRNYALSDVAHEQIAARLRIPRDYYDRIAAVPGLREANVNTLWQHKPELRMLRTLEGRARAYLSNVYRPYDNWDALQSVLPVLSEHRDLQVKSCTLTERRLYLQLVFPRREAKVRGDVVRAGVTVVNSEVGLGAVDVLNFLEILSCSNGAIAESLLRKIHAGRRLEGGDSGEAVQYRRDTIEADIRAFQLQLRDIMVHALDEAAFARRIDRINGAADDRMKDPELVLANVTRRFGLTDGESREVTKRLVLGGEPTRWGLAQSITSLARDIENRDRAFDLEKLGWDVVELKPGEWEALS